MNCRQLRALRWYVAFTHSDRRFLRATEAQLRAALYAEALFIGCYGFGAALGLLYATHWLAGA